MIAILFIVCCSLLSSTSAANFKRRHINIPNDLSLALYDIQSRISGGMTAKPGQIPWQAKILAANSRTGLVLCGGVLISGDWVLTAAQCVIGFDKFNIGLGVTANGAPFFQTTSNVKVANPSYNPVNRNNDIGLIKLPKSVSFSNFIQPIRLPTVSQVNAPFLNSKTTISGFGQLRSTIDGNSKNLQIVEMRVISNADCQMIYVKSAVIASTICARGSILPSEGACSGDSGGPMVIYEEGIPTLIGIISFFSSHGCDSGYPTGFTRTTSFLNWISVVTGIALRS